MKNRLPKVEVPRGHKHLAFAPPDQALSRWNPGIRAAHEGDENVITIMDVIGSDWFGEGVTAKRIAAALRQIGPRDVTVNINSPGGDVFEGIAIYNLLRDHPHAVTVNVMGLAASAASVIAMAGDTIRMGDGSFMMIHNVWGVVIGNRHDLRDVADVLDTFDDALAGIYAGRAGMDKSTAADLMDAESWFSADKAIEHGLADERLEKSAVTEGATQNSYVAIRRVEAALARQGLSRSERRSLLGEITGHPAVAGDTDDLAVAGQQFYQLILKSSVLNATP